MAGTGLEAFSHSIWMGISKLRKTTGTKKALSLPITNLHDFAPDFIWSGCANLLVLGMNVVSGTCCLESQWIPWSAEAKTPCAQVNKEIASHGRCLLMASLLFLSINWLQRANQQLPIHLQPWAKRPHSTGRDSHLSTHPPSWEGSKV